MMLDIWWGMWVCPNVVEIEWRQRQLVVASIFVLSYHHEMGSA